MYNLNKQTIETDKWINRGLIVLSIIIIISFLLSFFYIPIIKILRYAFIEEDTITSKHFIMIFRAPQNFSHLVFTINQAIISTVICLLFGLPIGYFLAKYEFPGKTLIINILTIPFVLPPVVVLLGFIITYGDGGWLNSLWKTIFNTEQGLLSIYGTYQGILLAHVFYNLSVIIRMSIPAWLNIDSEQINIARTLGAKSVVIFSRITLPQILNYIVSAALLVFIYTFNSFAIVLYLGDPFLQTLEVRIYKLISTRLEFELGAALVFLQLIINTFVVIFYLFYEKKTRLMAREKEKTLVTEKIFLSLRKNNLKNTFRYLGWFILLGIVTLFSITPLIAIIIRSFIPSRVDFSPIWGYKVLLSNVAQYGLSTSPLRMILNTLLFGFTNTSITLVISLALVFVLRNKYEQLKRYKTAYSEQFLSYAIILPMATSSISLAIGLFLHFKNTTIYSSQRWLLIILAHVLISIPFATRSILSSYNRIDVELINVASTLGASRLYIFRKIELPQIWKGIVVGGIFAFAISIGEFGATNFFYKPEYGTLSIGVYQLLSSRTIQLPATMATLLIMFTVLCFIAIQKLGQIELKV